MNTNNTTIIKAMSLNANKFFPYLNGGSVRTYIDGDNNPWFIARDVAEILGYRNTTQAIRDHVDDEDKCRLENERGVIHSS